MNCPECGAQVADTCPSCGARIERGSVGADQSEVKSDREAQVTRKGSIHPSITLSGLGAILMLISVVPNWYTQRCSGPDCSGWENTSISFANLTSDTSAFDLVWAGSGLPLVLMIVCASYIPLSIIYAFVTGSLARNIWAWLGSIALVCLVINYGYVLGEVIVEDTGALDYTLYVTPHAGWLLAIFGTVAVIIGSDLARRANQ